MDDLYKKLRTKELVDNKKDFQELIFMRQIRVNGKIIDNPNHKLDIDSQNIIKIGILEVKI